MYRYDNISLNSLQKDKC